VESSVAAAVDWRCQSNYSQCSLFPERSTLELLDGTDQDTDNWSDASFLIFNSSSNPS